MEKELEEILKDYMTARQIELAMPRVLRLFNVGRSTEINVERQVIGWCRYCPREGVWRTTKGIMCNSCHDTRAMGLE
jgi:hypothetical protein